MLLHVYDPSRCQLLLPGFDASLPSWHLRGLQRLARLHDTEGEAAFLRATSTSPECERGSFVTDVRAAHAWLIRAQEGGDGISHVPPVAYEWEGAERGWRRQLLMTDAVRQQRRSEVS